MGQKKFKEGHSERDEIEELAMKINKLANALIDTKKIKKNELKKDSPEPVLEYSK